MTSGAPATFVPKGRLRLREFLKTPGGVVGGILSFLFLLISLIAVAGWLPFDPVVQDATARLKPPSALHWFGTDQFGRDVFSRVASGITNSLRVSAVAITLAASIGTIAGVAAGYFRGWADGTVRGISDILLAFPSLLLALALAAVLDRNWFTVAIAIALVYIPLFVRVARAPVLSLREVEYVAAAKATGMGAMSIIGRHILPNITAILLVQITLALNWAILTDAALSFLGFGTPPPVPSLGVMIAESRAIFTIAPWVLLGPGAAIVLLVAGLNLLGDSLQAMLDPRKRGRL